MNKNITTSTVKTPAANFTGDVWLNPVIGGDGPSRLVVGLVRFTPGARTNWHSTSTGSCWCAPTASAWVGTRDGHTVTLRPGESVWTPAGEEHFHGGTAEHHDVPLRDPGRRR